jgi:hypothetical protein
MRSCLTLLAIGTLVGCGESLSPCKTDIWLGDTEVFLRGSDYKGPLPTCPDEELQRAPVWKLRVQGSRTRQSGDDPGYGHTDTVVSSELLAAVPCGVALVIRLKDRVVKLEPGADIHLLAKRVVRHFEDDVSISVSLRDVDGALLLGWANGHRPETWDADVFPEFRLTTEHRPVCDSGGSVGLRVSLTGEPGCAVDYLQEGPCETVSGPFVLRVPSAFRRKGGSPAEFIELVVSKPGLLSSAH